MARPRVTGTVDIDASGARKGADETEKATGRIAGAFGSMRDKASGSMSDAGDRIGGVFDRLKAKGDSYKDQFATAMGSVQSAAKDKLGPVGDIAEKVGIDLEKLKPSAILAGGAIAGLTTFVAGGVAKFQALTQEVQQYTSAAGVTAEQGSRLNAVFKTMGLEAEDGADVLKTMGEIIGTDAAKFDTYGVSIVKAKDGTTDMVGTLKAVADRFQEMHDPAQRAAMGSELFGDAWVKIAPLLAGGAEKVDQLLGSVSKSSVVTQDAIEQNRRFSEGMAKARQAIDNLQIAAGKEALPELVEDLEALVFVLEKVNAANDKVDFIGVTKGIIDNMNALKPGLELWRRYEEQQGRTGAAFEINSSKLSDLTGALAAAGSAAQQQAEDTAAQERKQREATLAAERGAEKQRELAAALDRATDAYLRSQQAITSAFSAELAYTRATDDATQSTKDLDEASQGLADRTNELGAEADETKAAQEEYARVLDDAKGKALAQADAAVQLAAKNAEVHGTTLAAQEANALYRDELVKVRDATGDPNLAAYLDNLIGRMGSVETAAWNAGGALMAVVDAARTAALEAGAVEIPGMGIVTAPDRLERQSLDGARAGGGPVLPGRRYLVGEQGPEILELGQSGNVSTLDQFAAQAAPAAGPTVLQVVLDSRIVAESVQPHFEQQRRSRL